MNSPLALIELRLVLSAMTIPLFRDPKLGRPSILRISRFLGIDRSGPCDIFHGPYSSHGLRSKTDHLSRLALHNGMFSPRPTMNSVIVALKQETLFSSLAELQMLKCPAIRNVEQKHRIMG